MLELSVAQGIDSRDRRIVSSRIPVLVAISDTSMEESIDLA